MKIKQHYYCLVDNNNKPDFRFIFTNKNDADKKRRQIKNSTTGETLFVSKHKRDFFVDGIKRGFIDKGKQINIKKGCWTTLKTKKISLLDTIKPETYFNEIIKTTQNEYSSQLVLEHSTLKSKLSKSANVTSSLSTLSQSPKITSTGKQRFTISRIFRLSGSHSVLKTNLFIANFAVLLLIIFVTVFYVNNSANKRISAALSEEQHRLAINQPKDVKNIAVLGNMDENNTVPEDEDTTTDNIDTMVFDTLMKFEKIREDQLEESINKMVAGTPMEKMAPYIAKKDKIVAAFLVGISKKESNYGRRVPVLNGKDCFNYWGYRGIRKRMGSGGHTCFDSPEDAIETVGGRIERLVKSGVDTPEEMVLWKCGSDCNATGGWPAAHKWIKDVNMYYTKMLTIANEDEKSLKEMRPSTNRVQL